MSLEKLQEAILDEARQQAQTVEQQLAEKTAVEKTRVLTRARQLEETVTTRAEKEGKDRSRRMHQEAELEARAAVLRAKQTELDTTKEALKRDLLSANKKETEELLTKLLSYVPEEKGTITAGKAHIDILKPLANNYHVVSGDFEGGFIYTASQTELNLTFDYLVDQLFARHRAELANILFNS